MTIRFVIIHSLRKYCFSLLYVPGLVWWGVRIHSKTQELIFLKEPHITAHVEELAHKKMLAVGYGSAFNWKPKTPDLSQSFATKLLCDFGQIASPLCVLVHLAVK